MVKYKLNLNSGNKRIVLPTKQSGVVLIVALVFLVALTAVAAALMQNTTTDIKMAGASQEKSVVTLETISEMDRIIFNERRQVNGVDQFGTVTAPVALLVTQPAITNATLALVNVLMPDQQCPRNKQASSNNIITCRLFNIVLRRMYGRNKNHTMQVNTGIARELPQQ